MRNLFFIIAAALFIVSINAQDLTIVNVDETDFINEAKSDAVSLNKAATTINITYDNTLLIPKKHSSTPSIWDINKSVANSYLGKYLFADNTEIDMDIYWWNSTSSDKTVFAVDPTWERIIFATNVTNEVKSYGDHSGEYQFSIPQGITTDLDGNVYVADAGNGKIVKFHYNTGSNSLSLVSVFNVPGMEKPTDIRFGMHTVHEGKPPLLWVIDRGVGKLFALTLTGQVYYEMNRYKYQGQYYNLEGIDRVVTPSNMIHYVYLFDNNNKRVIKAQIPTRDPNADYVNAIFVQKLPRSCYVTDVGSDAFGDLYVSDSYNNCLHKFDQYGGEYLGSYKNTSVINKPQRVSASNLKEAGRLMLNNYVANAWSSNYGIRSFLPGCRLYNLAYQKVGSDYYIEYKLTSTADLFIEVYRNGSLIKNEELLHDRSSGTNVYTLTGAEIGTGTIKVKMKYRPYFDEEYGSYAQGWQYQEITFSTAGPLAASISGPTHLESGEIGNFTTNATGGAAPYHYQWYYRYPDLQQVSNPAETLKKPPAGYWFSIGSDSPNLSKQDNERFQLKCTVTDNNNTSVTTSIHTVSVYLTAAGMDPTSKELLVTKLFSNYPNPFNPTTTIAFTIPERAFTTLVVYDILGNEVVTLVNGNKEPGRYEVKFNAGGLSSGFYIYKLVSGDYVESKKMLLLK